MRKLAVFVALMATAWALGPALAHLRRRGGLAGAEKAAAAKVDFFTVAPAPRASENAYCDALIGSGWVHDG
jgi:hypothetical protein